MTREEFFSGLRANWYLGLALALLPVAAIVAQRHWDETELQGVQAAAVGPAHTGPVAVLEGGMFKPAETSREDALAAVTRYQSDMKRDLSDDEMAVNYRRMGNLYYSPIRDYQKAVDNYEILLNRYPFWEGNRDIYPNLAEAYHRLGNFDMERGVYQRMVERFSEETQQHQFAMQKLDFHQEN